MGYAVMEGLRFSLTLKSADSSRFHSYMQSFDFTGKFPEILLIQVAKNTKQQ